MFAKMFAGRLLTTEATKTALTEEFFETRFFTYEEWKSYMNYAVYFQCQKFLAKEIQRINKGKKIFQKALTTQVPATISTKKPGSIIFRYFPKF
jgi:hypothetical protein